MKIIRTTTIIAALVLCSCQPAPKPVAGKIASDCAAACYNLKKKRCADGRNIKLGTPCNTCTSTQVCNVETQQCETTCESFCEDLTLQGVDLDLACVANAKNCTEAKECGN